LTVARNALIAIPAALLLAEPGGVAWRHLVNGRNVIPVFTVAVVETCALFLFIAGLGLRSLTESSGRERIVEAS
jgi:ABC-type spermidine/putrescine transport system permease subunit I